MALAVGDFDADGRDDIAIGLTAKPPFLISDGIVYIVFGASDFPDVVDLASDAHRIARFLPAVGSDGWFGYLLAVGDFDGDGIDDLAVSQPAQPYGSKVYVVGGPGMPSLGSVASDAEWFTTVRAVRTWEALGSGVSMGDINGDGMSDLVLGSPALQPRGKVTLVLGRPGRPNLIHLATESAGITVIPGAEFMIGIGVSNSLAAGDIDGDGRDDIIFSDHEASPPACQECGVVFVVFGQDAFPPTIHLDNPETRVSTLYGGRNFFEYGYSVFTLDFTGDGYADLAITNAHQYENGANELIVVYGSPGFPESVALTTDSTVSRIIGLPKHTEFGWAIGAVDMNLDGFADLVVGAYTAGAFGNTRAGRVYLFEGHGSPSPSGDRTPSTFALEQNFPNPFNPQTTIRFSIESPGRATLRVYNALGQLVRTLADGEFPAGRHEVAWDGRTNLGQPATSGVYFCRLQSRHSVAVRKMVLLR